jgi:hypothetical protein
MSPREYRNCRFKAANWQNVPPHPRNKIPLWQKYHAVVRRHIQRVISI